MKSLPKHSRRRWAPVSYEMLNEEQQRMWRALSVFPQTFDVEAAAVVWEMERDAAQDALSNSMKWSLVEFNAETWRYRLHDLARLFAKTRLSEAGTEETAAAQRRFALHYQTVIASCNSLYLEGNESMLRGLTLFDQEWGNIQAGQSWAESKMEKDRIAAQLCIDYPNGGAYVIDLRLRPRERILWLEVHLAAARKLKQRSSEGAALNNIGSAWAGLGKMRKAIELHEQALVIAREIGDRNGESIALFNVSLSADSLGDRARAIAMAEEALKIFKAIESPHAEMARSQLAEWREQAE